MADERYIEEDPELDQGSEATEEDGEGAGLYEHFAVVADKGQTPLRLDKFLTVRMEKCSRNRIQAAADCGNILVNGKPAKSSYKVKPLDRIQIVMPYPRREVEIIPEDIPLEIPYEDDDLLIVNKPAGLVVHPGHGNYSGTLVNALTYHLRNLPLFQEGDMRAGLVHRIFNTYSPKTTRTVPSIITKLFPRISPVPLNTIKPLPSLNELLSLFTISSQNPRRHTEYSSYLLSLPGYIKFSSHRFFGCVS